MKILNHSSNYTKSLGHILPKREFHFGLKKRIHEQIVTPSILSTLSKDSVNSCNSEPKLINDDLTNLFYGNAYIPSNKELIASIIFGSILLYYCLSQKDNSSAKEKVNNHHKE